MRDLLATLVGKTIRGLLVFRRSGGQALPGLIIERLFAGYVPSMLAKLPQGVVVITGTNGKTTTTKILTELLGAAGRRVLTNPTGSNLVRGIASSIAAHATVFGRLPYDIAILEIDEAAAKRLAGVVKPSWLLALNVSRDQLDRYGEVDTIAAYIEAAMRQATAGIITNAGDQHLLDAAQKTARDKNLKLALFGAAAGLSRYFPSDYELAAVNRSVKTREKSVKTNVDVELVDFSGQNVTYRIDGRTYRSKLKLTGQHNFLNAAAALELCRQLLPDQNVADLITRLSRVSLAFGRGEKYQLKNGSVIELVLVKNPASFSQALLSYSSNAANLMVAINDNIADGRDVSWLWDVDFSTLRGRPVCLTSGRRAPDMALRLSYDEIKTKIIEPDLVKSIRLLSEQNGPKVVLATYTAMLKLYKLLSLQGVKLP